MIKNETLIRSKAITANENKCEDKFCNGSECKQFLEYRLKFLNEQLQSATEHRKEHILQSISQTEIKLKSYE
ncbi:hypothetical protein UFOVP916_65 [uncultured Caudovirales phage]|uniref:Uncharacterized protein n=1 Tax=uncultured Caudovirales phage TaxID=2100421 RepID=A0A6J5SRM5_9CAUD|nr:hypothetical protein UFOVP827_20 [uncultured Caudovirales phage]CAB4171494.1 hypothetical protein UFOVP916_65 [uncultured Caudovirales phage]CAB4177335.1 hypothetical protein UFOVP1001_23 [uncultured Caudovirales phage]CAB4199522.1 hypothetical protein UFOVP1338_53 [uncultured Caudovirales phage]CAB4213517.1 hypothetical protein UFOVP1447_48 [uncultured Caudovirales phage]